ncbi:MAG: PAS domain-containing protein [Porticoccus sp.]|nr:PAS domain-containing protein [Porticoccus sp.]MBQ0807321.1 PAS domain-containing protein [Porticoccus sp.]
MNKDKKPKIMSNGSAMNVTTQENILDAINNHASVSITDADGKITHVNDKFCEITGFSRDELVGETHNFVKADTHSSVFYQELWATISTGKTWAGPLCNKRKDGSLYWSETTITPHTDDSGKPYQFTSIRTEITKAKAVEYNLRNQTKLLHLLNEATAVLLSTEPDKLNQSIGLILVRVGEQLRSRGICLWAFDEASMNIQLDYEWWASSTSTVYSESKKNLFSDFFAKEIIPDGVSITDYLQQVQLQINPEDVSIDGQQRQSTLFFPLQTHGKTTHVIQLEQPSNNPDNNVNEINILMILADTLSSAISRNRSEQLLSENKERLSRSQQYANIGTWDLDLKTNQLFASECVAPMFGLDPGELNTSFERVLATFHPEDYEKVIGAMNKSIRDDTLYDVEHRVVWPDGTVRWLHEKGAVTRDSEGNPLHMLGVIQDINDRKHAESILIKTREEAERANRAKSDFLSRMSHELRTPMNAILGFGKLMDMDPTLSEENKDNTHEILNAGHHLLNLINDVLDLARVESGHIELSIEPLEILPLIKESLALVGSTSYDQNINLSHSELQDIVISADKTRLKQIMINLLTNAIKYNKPGGSVHIKAVHKGDNRVRILVEDSGRGISKEKLEELFVPFNRLGADTTEIEGTGIGLTITKHLVEMMGGSIGVEENPKGGSIFWVELHQASATTPFQTPYSPSATTLKGRNGKPSVLYIDDDLENIKMITQLLSPSNEIRLLTATDSRTGIDLALSEKPNLIFLDINMPEMDPNQVVHILKSGQGMECTPVIAVSKKLSIENDPQSNITGFNDCLIKPLEQQSKFHDLLSYYLGYEQEYAQ